MKNIKEFMTSAHSATRVQRPNHVNNEYIHLLKCLKEIKYANKNIYKGLLRATSCEKIVLGKFPHLPAINKNLKKTYIIVSLNVIFFITKSVFKLKFY